MKNSSIEQLKSKLLDLNYHLEIIYKEMKELAKKGRKAKTEEEKKEIVKQMIDLENRREMNMKHANIISSTIWLEQMKAGLEYWIEE